MHTVARCVYFEHACARTRTRTRTQVLQLIGMCLYLCLRWSGGNRMLQVVNNEAGGSQDDVVSESGGEQDQAEGLGQAGEGVVEGVGEGGETV